MHRNELIVGQAVYYWPQASECGPYPKGQPLLALVSHIVSLPTPDAPAIINLGVLGMEGDWHKAKGVPFVWPGEPIPVTAKGAICAHATLPGGADVGEAEASAGEDKADVQPVPETDPAPTVAGDATPTDGEQGPADMQHLEGAQVDPVSDDEPKSLLGSSKLDAVIKVNDRDYQLGSVVVAAWKRSDLTPTAWNELADDKREALLDAELEAIAKGESTAESIPVDSNAQ